MDSENKVTLLCFDGALHFDAVLHRESGAWWGEVPTLPGCFSSGDTIREVEEDTVKAVELHLTGLLKRRLEEDAANARKRAVRKTSRQRPSRRTAAPVPAFA